MSRSATIFDKVCNYRSNETSTIALSSESYHFFKIFDQFKIRAAFEFLGQRRVLLYSPILPLNEKTVSLNAQVAAIDSTHLGNLDKPGNSFQFHIQNLIHIYPPNCLMIIIFIYRSAVRKSGQQIFVYLVKYLVIFFCVLTSEKFKARFLFVIKRLELL